MDRARLRLPLLLVAVAVVAEAGVLLLRPRGGVIEPAPVRAQAYFTQAQIERAHRYRRPQLLLSGAQLAIQLGLLVVLVRRPPAALRRSFAHPRLAAGAAGAALSLVFAAATLPLGAVARQRSVDVGLATQSWSGWAVDVIKSNAIGAAMAGAGALVLVGLMGRFPRHWWAPASVVTVGASAALLFAGPVLLDPMFNRFRPLPAGQARSDVLALARQAGVRVGEVYEVDASRRTTAANAYVTGLGSTKRVVLYDTLLENFTRDEVRLVVAHELAHVRHRDLQRGLLFLALVAPAALFAGQRLTERLSSAGPNPAVLPAAALSLALVAAVAGVVSNQLSRRLEAAADSFSLRLTGAPQPFIDFERRITVRNLADPDPPRPLVALMSTHPPTVERIGTALAFARGERPPGDRVAPTPPEGRRTPGGS